jgi:hypothetical protein
MDRPGRFAVSLGGRLVVLTLAVVATGCTMCPDPYDYSGPVPNGSAPQNDFRARSNGILPLGGSPRPWPPLVGTQSGHRGHQAGCRCGRSHGTPTLADPAVAQASIVEPIPEAVEPSSVLVAATAEGDATAAEPDELPPSQAGDEPATFVLAEEEPAAAPEGPLAVEQAEVVEPAAPEAVEVAVPRLAETPGWRARQAR